MNTAVAYAFPLRTLRRWRAEHLRLAVESDGSTRAEFALEGSTCGNIAFHLVYRVHLGPAASGHPLLALTCTPAPGDTNHPQMCVGRSNSAALAEALAWMPPLLGKSLAEAMTWTPLTSPDGCLCATTARAHKWRAVLHTLHFALHSPES